MKYTKLSVASLIAFSAASAFAWTNMPDICIEATQKVEAGTPTEIIKASLAEVGKGVQDPNLDRNKNFTQQEDTFIATWTATEASFYYGNPKMDKNKRAEFIKAAVSEYKSAKTKEQKIFLLSLMQNCPGEQSVATLLEAMKDKDKDVADAARMALQMNPEAGKALTAALKTCNNKVLKSGIVNALATRAFNGKKVPGVVKAAQATEKADATFDRLQKNPNYAASIIAGRNWDEKDGIEEFAAKFVAKPDKAVARKAIESGTENEFIFAAPYAFAKFPELIGAVKTRYEASSPALQAWILTSIGNTPSDAGRDFVIEASKKASDETVMLGAAWALSEIGDEPSAMALIDLHKAAWDKGSARNLVEYAAGAAKPSKAFDKAIADGAKAFDRSCLRLVAARGVYDAYPFLMQAIQENKERGDAMWSFRQMCSEADFIKICELAISTKDNGLCREILPLSQEVAKRTNNPEPLMAKLEALKGKAEAAGVKAPWDRAIELVKYRGRLPRK